MIRRIIPQTLFGRFLLIIIIPTVLVQLVATFMFYHRHWRSVSQHMVESLAGEIALMVHAASSTNKIQFPTLVHLAESNLYLNLDYYPDQSLSKEGPSFKTEYTNFPLLRDNLKKRISQPFLLYFNTDTNHVFIDVAIEEGLLRFSTSRKRITNSTTYIFILWMTGTAFILLIVAIIFSKNQIRSIRKLADAAERFGRGENLDDFKPSGAIEVRTAAQAFVEMHNRITRQIQQRTDMLAGVSHDLRTPITRMKLQLAFINDKEATEEFNRDLEDMEKHIQSFLDFARDQENEATESCQIIPFLEKLLGSFRHHKDKISLNTDEDFVIQIRPHALSRAITNVIENGLRYGYQVHVSVHKDATHYHIIIEDQGEGIDESFHEKIFKPFFRVDNSRNTDTGGTGLGLAIAKDIINSHGGTISVANITDSGFRLTISLPL